MKIRKKQMIAFLLTITICLTYFPMVGIAKTESDEIEWLIEKGILNSDFNKKEIQKNPDKKITRQEFVALLLSAIGETGTEKQFQSLEYADKNQIKKEFRKYYAKAEEYGKLKPSSSTGKKYLKPKRVLSRQVAALYLSTVTNSKIDIELDEFKDFKKVMVPMRPCVASLVRAGVMTGKTKTMFAPTNSMTWEEAASLVKNAVETGFLSKIQVKLIAGDTSRNSAMSFNGPTGLLAGETADTIYAADTSNNLIKKIQKGTVSILAGKVIEKNAWLEGIEGYFDGKPEEAIFNQPTGLCKGKEGILVTDTENNSIRIINTNKNSVNTFVGTGHAGMKNGDRKSAMFREPKGIAASSDGTFYVADTGNHSIRKIQEDGTVSTFAGTMGEGGYKDGTIENARFNSPTGIFCDGETIYVADTGNQRIRKIENGKVSTIAGSGTEKEEITGDIIGDYQDGKALSARFNGPVNLLADAEGTIYVSDQGNSMIRRIKDGIVSTVAGIGGIEHNGKGWEEYLVNPSGLLLSNKGDKLYVADTFYHTILEIQIES